MIIRLFAQGQLVPDNNVGCADVKRVRKYRQYLHVRGLYDIPLTKQQLEEKQRQGSSNDPTTAGRKTRIKLE